MKNKIRILSAIILVVSTAVTVFTACKSTEETETTTLPNTETTSKVHATDYTYNSIVITTEENETKYVHTVPPVPTFENRTQNKTNANDITTSKKTDTTSKNSSKNEKVEEVIKDISVISKTSPVLKGNSVSIIIQGTPNAKYNIEFYKNATEKADYDGLDQIIADSSGFASWNFTLENDCESGERKVIIKEKNSDKFIQTSITVQ